MKLVVWFIGGWATDIGASSPALGMPGYIKYAVEDCEAIKEVEKWLDRIAVGVDVVE